MGFKRTGWSYWGIKKSGETDSLGSSTAVPSFPNGIHSGSTTLTQAQLEGRLGSYIVKGGEVTLDGTNPTSVTVSGMTTIVAAYAIQKTTSAPGDDPVAFTVDYSTNVLDIYAWKNTGGTDPTLVASTNNSAVISWIAIGT